jgi:hypothetical protein
VNARVGPPQTTAHLRWPANASGPFSQTVNNLSADTEYSFRVCGQQLNGSGLACAQTRTFTTEPAVEDSARASWWSGCCESFQVDARSGPGGQNAHGSLSWELGTSSLTQETFEGAVTCLEVDGRRAVVGAVGEWTVFWPTVTTKPGSMLALVVDGVTLADRFATNPPSEGSAPPGCEAAQFGPGQTADPFEFVVNDASAPAL